jgi:hypothetical protein
LWKFFFPFLEWASSCCCWPLAPAVVMAAASLSLWIQQGKGSIGCQCHTANDFRVPMMIWYFFLLYKLFHEMIFELEFLLHLFNKWNKIIFKYHQVVVEKKTRRLLLDR